MCKGFVAGFASAATAAALIGAFGFAPQQDTKGKPAAPPVGTKAPAPPMPGGKQGKPGDMPQGMPGMDPKMMEAMQAFATPGREHMWLAKKAGNWTTDGKFYMAPNAPPTQTTGTSSFKMVLGGRYLMEEVKGSFMNMPFDAIGYTGYDNGNKIFESTWMDSQGTAITNGTGKLSADMKTMTFTGEMFDPAAGKNGKYRGTETWKDDNTFTMEMWGPGADGKEMKMMEITYTRAGGPKAGATAPAKP